MKKKATVRNKKTTEMTLKILEEQPISNSWVTSGSLDKHWSLPCLRGLQFLLLLMLSTLSDMVGMCIGTDLHILTSIKFQFNQTIIQSGTVRTIGSDYTSWLNGNFNEYIHYYRQDMNMIWTNHFIILSTAWTSWLKPHQNCESLKEYIEMEVTIQSIYEGKTTLCMYLGVWGQLQKKCSTSHVSHWCHIKEGGNKPSRRNWWCASSSSGHVFSISSNFYQEHTVQTPNQWTTAWTRTIYLVADPYQVISHSSSYQFY